MGVLLFNKFPYICTHDNIIAGSAKCLQEVNMKCIHRVAFETGMQHIADGNSYVRASAVDLLTICVEQHAFCHLKQLVSDYV